MGLFDGTSYSTSGGYLNPGGHNGRSSSRNRGVSPARSTRSVKTDKSGGGYYVRPSNSRSNSSNFFGGGGHGYGNSRSGSSFFGSGGSGFGGSRGIFSNNGSSSYYKRRPRDGYISYLMHKLQRMFKELWYYARRHPVKAFFAVIVPLLSAGGAISGLMRQFGVRLPFGLDGGMRRGGGGYYGSEGYGGSHGGGGRGGWMDQAGGLMQVAKMFM